MFALLAGMEIESALRALAHGIGEILQQRSAFGAARDRACARHVNGTRSESVFFFWSGRRLIEFFFRSRARILVSALPILAVGQKCLLKNAFIVRLCSAAHKRFFAAVVGQFEFCFERARLQPRRNRKIDSCFSRCRKMSFKLTPYRPCA